MPTARRLLNSGLSAQSARRYRRTATPERPQEIAVTTGATAPAPTPTDPDSGSAAETVEVPDDITKVDDLKDWVGDDPDRAQAVIDRENSGSYQRKTLLSHMAEIVVGA